MTRGGKAMQRNNLTPILQKFRETKGLSREDWQNYSLYLARQHLKSAPPEIRERLLYGPFRTPPDVVELVETFAMLLLRAEDRAEASNTDFLVPFVWAEAIRLTGGTP